ncbi:thymocyte selection-associated high mobility group box protein TOX-like isoform X1 [Oncorhynchus masou masou]|uniref:thymocyte selection-associated high mobility group box protein TOX-like isoform X1 n=1 Tax=Oncorhynchus masou masou TaxID=90313 RepID=UPI0031837EAC
MDVRFYPTHPSSVGSDPSCLSSLDYYHANKARYGAGGRGVHLLHSTPPPGSNPAGKRLPTAGFDGDNMYMNDNNQEFRSPSQNYSSQGRGSNSGGGGDEDYEIPPITPPNHADPSLLHLMDPESGYTFHSLPHNGLLNPYSYPELPAALMMSNMLSQDSHLLSGHNMHSIGEKRPSSEMTKPKPKPQKKKKKKDPNEPSKPVSAYALFFRDTQAAIKGSNPNATFGDVSKIVASMWDSLGEEQKQAYKRRTEAAKKEYLKALATYRASLVSKTYDDPVEPKSAQSSQPSHMLPPKQPLYSMPPQPSSPYGLGPGSFPLSDLQSFAGPPRHALTRTLSQSQMLPPSMSASPPSPFQISPPLHPSQLALHQSSLRMQQVQSHSMGLQGSLHSPPLSQQGFSHIQDYQNSVGGSQSPGAPNPGHGQKPDWDGEYCNRDCGPNHCSSGMGVRDKPLYLT